MIDMRIANEKLGKILADARRKSNMTQQEVADRISMSLKTIRNWESGYSAPTFPQTMDFFEAIQQNPNHYYHLYAHPESFDASGDSVNEEKLDESLIYAIKNHLTLKEKEELAFLFFGNHGSSRYATLQEVTANLHCDISSRHLIAEIVRINFERDKYRDCLVCETDVMPDLIALEKATKQGRIASLERKKGYNIDMQ